MSKSRDPGRDPLTDNELYALRAQVGREPRMPPTGRLGYWQPTTRAEATLWRQVGDLIRLRDRLVSEVLRLRAQEASGAVAGDGASVEGGMQLTARQQRTLLSLAAGESTRAAARRLGVSETAIKGHRRALYNRLGCVRNSGAAVVRGLECRAITLAQVRVARDAIASGGDE